jgi:Putative zinc-finger
MSEWNPTEQNPSHLPPDGSRKLRCEDWEGLIAEALDGTLSAGDSAAFEQHRRECAACARMLEEVRQGAAWLDFLGDEPEMPADLMAKILARTSGAAEGSALPAPVRIAHPSMQLAPAWHRIAPVARRVFEPRLMMTAAMAFFSIALTLNLAGIKLSEVRLADLQPSTLRTNLTRQYYSVKAQGVKYYDNIRFVYEMEARVRELRRASESEPAQAPAPVPQRGPSPSSRNDGNSRRPPRSDARSSTPQQEKKRSERNPVENDLKGSTVLANEARDPEPLGQPWNLSPQAFHNEGTQNTGLGLRPWKTRAQAERSWA